MDKILNLFASLVPDADVEMQKRLVQIWSENDDIHGFLMFHDIPGEKSPEISVESPQKEKKKSEKKEEKKKSEKKEEKKKSEKSEKKEEKKESVEKDKKFDPVIFLKKNPETVIEFIQENPKKSGSTSHEIYEKYKSATTFQEFLDNGGENKHMRFDFNKGFIKILHDSVDNIEYEPKKKKTPAKNPNKVKKEVKKDQKNKVKKEEIVIQANNDEDDEEEDVVPFKPFGNINSDSSSDEECQDDDEMPIKTVDGVDYCHNKSDNLLIDKTTAKQIGYLHDDGTIDYIDNGEEIHEKNKLK